MIFDQNYDFLTKIMICKIPILTKFLFPSKTFTSDPNFDLNSSNFDQISQINIQIYESIHMQHSNILRHIASDIYGKFLIPSYL